MNPVRIRRVVRVPAPLPRVFDYLADFTTTTEWDPGTVRTERLSGDGGVGTRYRNTSRFLGRESELEYTVIDHVAGRRIRLRGENATVVAADTMEFRAVDGQSEVTYTAEFTFKGWARWSAPLLTPALNRLGDEAKGGMHTALLALTQA